MKFAIDTTLLINKTTGMERVVFEASKSLIDACPNDKFVLLFWGMLPEKAKPLLKDNVNYVIIEASSADNLRNIKLPQAFNNINADINLFFGFPTPNGIPRDKCISIVHDLNPFKYADTIEKDSSNLWCDWLTNDITSNLATLTVSNTIKNEINKKFNVTNIKRIYPGYKISETENNEIFKAYNIKENDYLLFVSTLEPRKNIKLLVEAYTELFTKNVINSKLVVAGKMGWNLSASLCNKIEKSENIIWTDHVNDSKLAALYKNCRLFIMPSIYEGFGLPVTEAIAYGAPILVSNIPVFKEITKSCAHYFKSNDIESLKYEIIKALEKPKENYIVDKSILKEYNWKNFGIVLRSYIKDLCNINS